MQVLISVISEESYVNYDSINRKICEQKDTHSNSILRFYHISAMIWDKKTLNCHGRLVVVEKPMVMGIINATPDSFHAESRSQNIEAALTKTDQMIKEGVDILDIGGVSTRPGAVEVPVEEELQRVIPIIKEIKSLHPDTLISIDTYQSRVAEAAVNAGADIINDISAGRIDQRMYDAVADLDVPYILMHMKGNPATMQFNPTYENVCLEVLDFFIWEIDKLRKRLVKDILLDPGFGFGKLLEHNYQLLNGLHAFRFLECPLLVGLSRKSMIHRPLKILPDEALNGTTALHMKALQEGAKFLRVHDVKEAVEAIQLFQLLENNQPNGN